MRDIAYHEAAEEELLNEIGYLELRSRGLGREFHAEIRRVEALIAQFPQAGREIKSGVRTYPLRKFRFSLVYRIDEDRIFVIAVAHQRRRPNYWIRRIRRN